MIRGKIRVRDRFAGRRIGRPVALALIPAAIAIVGGLLVFSRGAEPPPERPSPAPVVVAPPEPVRPAPRPTRVVSFAEGCASAECHGPMGDRPHVHETFREQACDLCHAPDIGGHVYPQLAGTADTCTQCHATGADHRFQHKAMSEDACLACHDPHASAAPALLVAGTVEQTCVRCHPSDRGSVPHQPYVTDGCTECHDQHGANNPMLLLGGEGEDHCGRCHAPVVAAEEAETFTHLEVEGRCLGCHEPHVAHEKGLLPARPRDLCVTCHEDVAEEVAGATVSHESVLTGKQCITCHDPHASSRPAMFRDTQAKVCLSCHDEPVQAAGGREVAPIAASLESSSVVHGAVSLGACSDCHAVHGSTFARLLRAANTDVLVGEYDIQKYTLCFSCHDRALAELPNATLFREGRTNLHALHLQREGAAGGCGDCHAVHSGSQPRLIVETVHYQGSEWATPMNFTMTPEGGSCAPGCHDPMRYTREAGGTDSNDGECP